MSTNKIQGDCSHNEGIGQINMTSEQIKYNPSIYHNRNRNRPINLLLIAILVYKCCAVTGETAEPPDCTGIVCNLECPSDSKVERIDNYDPIISSINIIGAMSSRRKRAILMRKRESIKIVPGDYNRHRREINDSIVDVLKCCECKCDFSKCSDLDCPPNEYKIILSQGSRVPGRCCPTYQCTTQRPTCYSLHLKQHFDPLETWREDDCTHCECSEIGEPKCEISSCRPLVCEKKLTFEGVCCPVCDISDRKFCEDCEIQCPNGFVHDTVNNCAMCACAQSTPTTKRTTVPMEFEEVMNSTNAFMTTTTQTWNSEPSTDSDANTNAFDSANTSTNQPINDADNWYVELPIVLGICVTIGAFAIIMCLTCRHHICHKKDKHHINRKQHTPLIRLATNK